MSDALTYSVIVPVKHRRAFLERALRSIANVNYPQDRYEVIVVGPEDDTGSRHVV